jgi:hypothetical protein
MGGLDVTAVETTPPIDLSIIESPWVAHRTASVVWIERPLMIHDPERSVEMAASPGPVPVDTLSVQISYSLSCYLHCGPLGSDLAAPLDELGESPAVDVEPVLVCIHGT